MRLFFSLILLLSILEANAQNLNDVVRYSVVDFASTGRAIGAGGSFSAIGADFSLVGSNPAGLASFRKSEFVITPGFDLNFNTANLSNDNSIMTNDTRRRFHLSNAGFVIASHSPERSWKTLNFGIGVNRIANFHNNITYSGATVGSITDRWLELSQDFTVDEVLQDPFEAGLAYDAGATFMLDGYSDRDYFTDYFFSNQPSLSKSQTIEQRGYISEFAISLAGNYRDKLYLGATLGLPILFFEEERTYREEDIGDQVDIFDELTFTENLSASGGGANFKIGAIYRVNQKLRVGIAAHTATVLNVDEDFSTSLDYRFTDPNFPEQGLQQSPQGIFEYSIRTPWRLSASLGSIIARRGFISAEVEYVDYTSSRFNFDSGAGGDIARENDLNEEINTTLNTAANVRIGGEWTYKIYRFRAGVILIGAVSDDVGNRQTYHAGLGLRKNAFFMDLAYRLSNSENSFFAYRTQLLGSQQVEDSSTENLFVLTFGFKI